MHARAKPLGREGGGREGREGEGEGEEGGGGGGRGQWRGLFCCTIPPTVFFEATPLACQPKSGHHYCCPLSHHSLSHPSLSHLY